MEKDLKTEEGNFFFTRTGDDLEKPIDESDLLFYEKYFITEKIPHDFMLIEKLHMQYLAIEISCRKHFDQSIYF